MIKAEPGIPMPPGERGRRGAPRKYPFHDMAVGESFFVPLDVQIPKIVRNAASWHEDRYGLQFRVAAVEGGCRCWRTK